MHDEDGDMKALAVLFVEIAADRLAIERADEAGFFPGFLEGGFTGGVAGIDPALGNDPAFAVARGDEAEAPVAQRQGRCLSNPTLGSLHRCVS